MSKKEEPSSQKQKRRRGDRKEATRVRQYDSYTAITPYLMQTRTAST